MVSCWSYDKNIILHERVVKKIKIRIVKFIKYFKSVERVSPKNSFVFALILLELESIRGPYILQCFPLTTLLNSRSRVKGRHNDLLQIYEAYHACRELSHY